MLAKEMKELIVKGKVYDLGQPYFPGMPHHPNHPPFVFSLTKKHGDVMYPNQVSSANDLFATGGHTGTHLDSLGHISRKGKLFGNVDASRVQSYTSGLKRVGIDVTPPVIRRGILLDVARTLGKNVLPPAFPIGPKEFEKTVAIEGVTFKAGDVVLIRTGWAKYWKDPKRGKDRELGFTSQMFEPYGIAGLTFEDKGLKGLNYEKLSVILWEQNKQLLQRVERLEAEITKRK